MRMRKRWLAPGVVLALLAASVSVAAMKLDFGQQTEKRLAHKSRQLFGVRSALPSSSSTDLNEAQALADPTELVTLAKGLKASVVAAGPDDNVGPNSDQMVLWPPSHPTFLIAVNEEGTGDPALQKINLQTGRATTIATGTDDNDPVRTTPWGTIIFGEEAADGAMYEIIDPLSVEGATIDRTTGISSSPKIRRLDALGFNAFEGLAVLPNGVTYYGTELAPTAGAAGGARAGLPPASHWRPGLPVRHRLVAAAGRRERDPAAAARRGRQSDRLLPPRGHRRRHARPRSRQRSLLWQQHRSRRVALVRRDDLPHRRDSRGGGERQHDA